MPVPKSATKVKKRADVYGSILNLPLKSNTFDTILSTQVLEHVPEPKVMLKEAYRTLKGGGYLILTAPMHWGLHEEPHDYYRYTKHGLKYLAETVGFKVEYIKARTGFWNLIGQRLSSHAYNAGRTPNSVIGQMSKRIICACIQIVFILLDKIIGNDEKETLGYILVAKKEGMGFSN